MSLANGRILFRNLYRLTRRLLQTFDYLGDTVLWQGRDC